MEMRDERRCLLRTTAKQDLLRSIAYITWPGLTAPTLGPPVADFINSAGFLALDVLPKCPSRARSLPMGLFPTPAPIKELFIG
jgi:hypothetical protein